MISVEFVFAERLEELHKRDVSKTEQLLVLYNEYFSDGRAASARCTAELVLLSVTFHHHLIIIFYPFREYIQ